MTDQEIQALINVPKYIPRKWRFQLREESGFLRFDAQLEADVPEKFVLKGRVAIDDSSDYSAILHVVLSTGEKINLIRCNGPHKHKNKLEKTHFNSTHMHMATERYMEIGAKAEGFAFPLNHAYHDLETAVEYLMNVVNIGRYERDENQMTLL